MQDNQILISAYDEILKARRFVATAEWSVNFLSVPGFWL